MAQSERREIGVARRGGKEEEERRRKYIFILGD
jgi:hypothetical protein